MAKHAWAFAEEFDDATPINFQTEWVGLKGRVTATINPERYYPACVCQTDRRVVFASVSKAELIGDLPTVVSRLYAPANRMFDPQFSASPDWFRSLLPGFVDRNISYKA